MSKQNLGLEQKTSPEPNKIKQHRVRKLVGRVALAAACVIPTADLALSDAAGAKVYEVVQEKVDLPSKSTERAVETGIVGAVLAAESLGLGLALTKTKKLEGAFSDFNDYLDEKEKSMSKPRRIASRAVNAPFTALQKLGQGIESLGEKVASRKSKIARTLGKIVIDTGNVNAIGTSGVIMQETLAGNPPSLARNARLAGLITASWLGAAEGIKSIYRGVPAVRPPLAAIGRTYELFTTMNVSHPWETPVGSVAIGATAVALAVTGWRIGEFHKGKEEMHPDPVEDFAIPTTMITDQNGNFSTGQV